MPYQQRLAIANDTNALTSLWEKFAHDRAEINPSMKVKPNFDFKQYVEYQLKKKDRYCFILEYYPQENPENKTIVGFLYTYIYDESPPPNLPPELSEEIELQTPFLPRKVGSVLGLYVEEKHRGIGIKILIESALKKSEELGITDLDLLISEDQLSLQKFLEKKYNFTKSGVQFVKHYL